MHAQILLASHILVGAITLVFGVPPVTKAIAGQPLSMAVLPNDLDLEKLIVCVLKCRDVLSTDCHVIIFNETERICNFGSSEDYLNAMGMTGPRIGQLYYTDTLPSGEPSICNCLMV